MKSQCAKNGKFPFSRGLACFYLFIFPTKNMRSSLCNVFLIYLTHHLSFGIHRLPSQQRSYSLRKEDGHSQECTFTFIKKGCNLYFLELRGW